MTEIRLLAPDDVAGFMTVAGRAYLSGPGTPTDEAVAQRRRTMDFSRAYAAYDGDRVVASYRSFPTELSLPGGRLIPASAVSSVAVAASHRRRGLLTELIGRDLDATVDRGEPLAVLIAMEWPIYGRYGFGAASEHVTYRVDTRRARFAAAGAGTVDYAERAVLGTVGPDVYARHHAASPGEVGRPPHRWDAVSGAVPWPWGEEPKLVTAVYRGPGGSVDGYLLYTVEDTWQGRVSTARVKVNELLAATREAYAELWRFACSIDLITEVEAGDRSVAEPLPWLLTDARAAQQADRADFLWVRLLDVERALAERRYLAAGRVVLQVRDAGGYAAGRYALDAGPDGATCARTDEPADLTLDVATLGSAYLGGFPLAELGRAGLVDEHRRGALATADAMFRWHRAPWSATWF